MKRYHFLLLCSLIFLATTSTAKPVKPFTKETLTVGLLPEDYPPLYWHKGQKGIVQQLLSAIEANSRFTFEVRRYPFKRLIQHVADGKLDFEAWSSPVWRQAIKDKVYFTEPFTQHCETMVFRKNKAYTVRNPTQLIGKRVGTVQDFTFPGYTALFEKKLIRRISGTDDKGVLKMLTLGRSDLAFMDKIAADFLIKEHHSSTLETKNIFDCVPITFMFNKAKSHIGKEINPILQELKFQKKIEKIKHTFH